MFLNLSRSGKYFRSMILLVRLEILKLCDPVVVVVVVVAAAAAAAAKTTMMISPMISSAQLTIPRLLIII